MLYDSYGMGHYDLFGKTVYEYIKDNTCDGDVVYMTCIEWICITPGNIFPGVILESVLLIYSEQYMVTKAILIPQESVQVIYVCNSNQY
jgi:hypothetical protein